MPKSLYWTDILEITLSLIDKHPNIDPLTIRFTDLHKWVCELDGFVDNSKNSNEKILEAIQMTWINEL